MRTLAWRDVHPSRWWANRYDSEQILKALRDEVPSVDIGVEPSLADLISDMVSGGSRQFASLASSNWMWLTAAR